MKNIRLYSLHELQALFVQNGFRKSHATRVYHFAWYEGGKDLSSLQELPAPLLEWLHTEYTIPVTELGTLQRSQDGTLKCTVRLHDGNMVETVLIPAAGRMTVCVSSQVGCSLSCKFCATGYMERRRNLGFDEIADQVSLLNELALKEYGRPVSNVVFMGMGEPLLNYTNVIRAIERLTDQRGLSIAPKRITISTAGVAKMIRKLAGEGIKVNLALSLHAANDEKRNTIMPINETNNLYELEQSLNYFHERSRNEITLEYVLLRSFNDSIEDAEELIRFSRKVPVHLVNILEFNPIAQADFEKPGEEAFNGFVKHLLDQRVNAHLRRSRGKDIDAACGQLAGTEQGTLPISEQE